MLARGSVYSSGPVAAYDHQEIYLRTALGFIGITDMEAVRVEGVAFGPDSVNAALAEARNHARQLGSRQLAAA